MWGDHGIEHGPQALISADLSSASAFPRNCAPGSGGVLYRLIMKVEGAPNLLSHLNASVSRPQAGQPDLHFAVRWPTDLHQLPSFSTSWLPN